MIYKFTKRAEKAVEIAGKIAMQMGHKYIGTEHIIYGLIEEGKGVGAKVLSNQDITSKKVKQKIEEILGIEEEVEVYRGFTLEAKKALEIAYIETQKLNYTFIGTEQLLYGILKQQDGISRKNIIGIKCKCTKNVFRYCTGNK